jgi:hypothetical protein
MQHNQKVAADWLNILNIVQASVVLSTAGKYTLAMIDAAMEGRWASKGTYVFYLELVTDILHLFVYLIFFIIVFANYGLPLHLVRYNLCAVQSESESHAGYRRPFCRVSRHVKHCIIMACKQENATAGAGSVLDIPQLPKQGR